MRYTFIVFEIELPKKKTFEMLLVESVTDVMVVVRKIIGPNCVESALNPHALFDTRRSGDVILPTIHQMIMNPVTIGNQVFHNMVEMIQQHKKKIIINEKGGYQVLLDDMNSIGWKEIRREKRNDLNFHYYE